METIKTCKICFIKKLFSKKARCGFSADNEIVYDNKAGLLPPMGWSSWNTFRNNIDQDLILQTAEAMKQNGLVDAGYIYLNLDDCWHSSERDADGKLQGDLVRFSEGIADLVKKVNAMGLKVGIYSSNGKYTCEELPASLCNEEKDALTFAEWGIEYFKYDFCHNIPISKKAPYVYKIDLFDGEKTEYFCADAKLLGEARLKKHPKLSYYVKGLDADKGRIVFEVESSGDKEYVLTVHTKKEGRYDKFLIAEINGAQKHHMSIPPQKIWNLTYRHQIKIKLKNGKNTIALYNPIKNSIDSSFFQYKKMGQALVDAVERVYKDQAKKPIVYSICEWGRNKPWLWGRCAGNLWRTTPDIRPIWVWIVYIYNKTIKLAKYAQKGGWNDPDMLEVGNGKLSYDQNKSHFSLWCMMNAPLILGNDLRKISSETLGIVTNKNMIALNQDELGDPAERIIKGSVDVLAKKLSDGVALCFFNKTRGKKQGSYNLDKLLQEKYDIGIKDTCQMKDMWTDEAQSYDNNFAVELLPYQSKVIKIFETKK